MRCGLSGKRGKRDGLRSRSLRLRRDYEQRSIEKREGKLLSKLANHALAVGARVVCGRTGIIRLAESRRVASLCGKQKAAVAVHGFGCRRISDESEQHEGQDALQRRIRAVLCCCGVTGHLIERYVTV